MQKNENNYYRVSNHNGAKENFTYMYEKPAAAGPKKKSVRMVPLRMSWSVVVKEFIPKANIRITINQRGS